MSGDGEGHFTGRCPGRLECGDSLLDTRTDLGVQPFSEILCGHADDEIFYALVDRRERGLECEVGRRRIAFIVSGNDIVEEGGVGDIPAKRADLVERGGVGYEAVTRHAAVSGF